MKRVYEQMGIHEGIINSLQKFCCLYNIICISSLVHPECFLIPTDSLHSALEGWDMHLALNTHSLTSLLKFLENSLSFPGALLLASLVCEYWVDFRASYTHVLK